MRNLFQITMLAALVALMSMPAEASLGLARKASQELVEHLIRTGGSKAVKEIAEFGGEQAVRQVLRRAAQEGGQAMARQTAQLVRTHGVGALRAVQHSPALMVRNLNALPEAHFRPAIPRTCPARECPGTGRHDPGNHPRHPGSLPICAYPFRAGLGIRPGTHGPAPG